MGRTYFHWYYFYILIIFTTEYAWKKKDEYIRWPLLVLEGFFAFLFSTVIILHKIDRIIFK